MVTENNNLITVDALAFNTLLARVAEMERRIKVLEMSKGVSEDAFEVFWNAYPSKTQHFASIGRGNKHQAKLEWNKQNPPLDICLKALEYQKKQKDQAKLNREFVPSFPHAVVWIKGQRWEEIEQEDCEVVEI